MQTRQTSKASAADRTALVYHIVFDQVKDYEEAQMRPPFYSPPEEGYTGQFYPLVTWPGEAEVGRVETGGTAFGSGSDALMGGDSEAAVAGGWTKPEIFFATSSNTTAQFAAVFALASTNIMPFLPPQSFW